MTFSFGELLGFGATMAAFTAVTVAHVACADPLSSQPPDRAGARLTEVQTNRPDVLCFRVVAEGVDPTITCMPRILPETP